MEGVEDAAEEGMEGVEDAAEEGMTETVEDVVGEAIDVLVRFSRAFKMSYPSRASCTREGVAS